MHIVWTMANNTTIPYFTWFADELLANQQHQITFIILYPKEPEIVGEMRNKGITCYWVPFDNEHRIGSYFKSIPKLYRLLKQLKPDILHSHLFDDSVPALIAARMAKIRVRAITKADAGFHWNFKPKGVPFDKLNNFNANLIITLTEENKAFVINKEKANINKITRIHHGILDISEQITTNNRQQLIAAYQLHGKLVIGMVSRLIEWKGVKNLLQLAPAIIKRFPNCKILICGEGPQRKEFEDYIIQHHLEAYVILTGRLQTELIPSLYSLMDVFVHLAKLEPFGLVISEAMMCGTGVIATATGAARDAIKHKKNGYLINEADYNNIIDGIDYIVNHKTIISKNARESALKLFSIHHMYINHIHAYNNALKLYNN